jgi:N-acetylglutamate synthase-like GNAT family acetyltransferase
MKGIEIIEYNKAFEQETIDLIVGIQAGEFKLPITAEDQPDLRKVSTFYQQGNGNFWQAIDHNKVVGTIALIDIGNNQVALRKMFVHTDYRGKDRAAAWQLMQEVFAWCRLKGVKDIFLGTVDQFKASHRFYEKNGFVLIDKQNLPDSFPPMPLDTIFYTFSFHNQHR